MYAFGIELQLIVIPIPIPTNDSPDTNRCQEEVPYGGDEFELDHRGGLP